ncbi:isoleucine--tRNA ligase [Candidatus Gottesmanbacteria bacterium RIFCSPHIGHO2_02_FULL_39_14]|uniref:Isoleucine--tRNA ligase n=1 Tax=Candidatus Gottesmanbacteria bacterium RIFCSPHIGHO2_02_FULL_39_14 TaxID=1798383 RepID=A0A1F6A139_9BACT|nr:MAG: isoleucine--tRNA ligase [Candidatus Gottesmanbacteria bacterium RIFCSPHIGHO2_02_FULL_39_14]
MFKPVSPHVDFVRLEQEVLAYWHKNNILAKYLDKNTRSSYRFSFFDGPITANNPMGVHHAWGRTYKDLWQRFFNLKGFNQRFQNGFDCQGLWVEVEVEKELGLKSKKDIENLVAGDKEKSISKFVNLCRERVYKYAAIQTKQSIRLGYFMDWQNSYYTMSDENNYMIWHFLKVCWKRGWIYKGNDVVPWCPRCETAISQHEILTEDYQEVSHETVYLKFPIIGCDKEYLTVWTTTPWTIPANTAVAVGKDLSYSLVEVNQNKYWVAKDLVKSVFPQSDIKIVKEVKGEALSGLKYIAPYDHLPNVVKAQNKSPELFHAVVVTDEKLMPISIEEGTGLVHTSPSTGEEDFKLGKKLNLPLVNPVICDNADYRQGFGQLSGKNAKRQPEIILDYLKNEGRNFLLKTQKIKHRYPRCWRCKTELVWKVAKEWYIAMDKIDPTDDKKRTLRQQLKDVSRHIKWLPAFGRQRELDWLENMHDWLISKKNRYWGLALPIYECSQCAYFEVIGGKEELQKKAVKGWEKFSGHSPHKPWIDEVKIICTKCQSAVERIADVGNPWLDAGIISFSTITKNNQGSPLYKTARSEWKKWFPADFITESFPGQFKNWFYSLLVMGTVLEKTNPFKTVLGFATLLGEDSRPMHKSWGNAIEFNTAADKIGVDVMRWMFVKQDPEQNILFGFKRADETRRKFHLLLWNVYNFFITYANIDGFIPDQKNYLTVPNLLDRWILSRLNSILITVNDSLLIYDVHNASLTLEDFVTDLSQWYVRRSRDRVGPTSNYLEDKNNCYRTLYTIQLTLSKILSPFIPFLSENIFLNLTDGISVHLSSWPVVNKQLIDKKLENQMIWVRKLVEKGHRQRKEKGIKVRQPLIKLEIKSDNRLKKVNDQLWQIVLTELNIKNLFINGNLIYPAKEVKVSKDLLDKEGEARELVRNIQIKRKDLGFLITDKIILTLKSWPEEYTDYIKRETLAVELEKGDDDKIIKV